MQTFLPYPDFARSARVLDRRRLGKQRVETLQVLRAATVPGYGWFRHPATAMWSQHVPALVAYGRAMVDEWTARGGADSTGWQIREFAPQEWDRSPDDGVSEPPPWLGDEALHRSHRSNLLRKDEDFYRPLFPEDPAGLDYVWPVPAEGRAHLTEPGHGHRAWVLGPGAHEEAGAAVVVPFRVPEGIRESHWVHALERIEHDLREGEPVLLLHGAPGPEQVVERAVLAENVHHAVAGFSLELERVDRVLRRELPEPARLQSPRPLFAVPAGSVGTTGAPATAGEDREA
ncbi:MSMEG_6728 family protein [Kocuria rosea]|uniref:MSMEG_6728 family protein n=1 Tax=Kocuria rosea TaxID=1275 RepID=UPI00203E8454|nr:MSMEG_6728 family protein [Kocuria rosea]MCM3688476.1 MSMEG_6728 family protein [Kocuria rosea]HST71647.1 MSMEG_6728 family protein [Kocuria rosea]